MTLEAFSGAASLALLSTFVFLLLAKSWQVITKAVGGTTSFPGHVMLEAAQRFRDELEELTRRLHVYLTSALVFVVIFSVSYFLRPGEIFSGLPHWQVTTIVAILACVCLYGAYRLVALLVARRRTSFIRDAVIAAGHGLQKLSANRNRVFYDVCCSAGIIDNVIVGLHGVYAVHVVARKPGKNSRVRLSGDTLEFAPGNHSMSLEEFGRPAQRLAREFKKILKHEVRIRSVVAVPGWEIESQASSDHLIVNERNLAMLRGWKDQNDYLLNEEVDKLHQLLTERCSRYKKSGGRDNC